MYHVQKTVHFLLGQVQMYTESPTVLCAILLVSYGQDISQIRSEFLPAFVQGAKETVIARSLLVVIPLLGVASDFACSRVGLDGDERVDGQCGISASVGKRAIG